MTSIAHQPLTAGPGDPWPRVVAQARGWAEQAGVALRDTIVLVPFAQLLPPARRAWATAGGWMPRIETTQTLARSLGPAPAASPDAVTLDRALDRLAAQRLLRSTPGAVRWMRRDPRGFRYAVDAVVQTAHALVRAAAAVAPDAREAHWNAAREQLGGAPGPGGVERLLARVALEWAAVTRAPTDRLHGLRPAAWIVVQAGGPDPLARALAASGAPALVLDADVPLDDPFEPVAASCDVALGACADLEDEAQRAAAHVIAEVDAGHVPVALIAQDRLLVRRVRALLARRAVALQDETGWKLSTTRAAATVAALLRAAMPGATTDAWIDWLKSGPAAWPVDAPEASLQSLEGALRRRGWAAPASVDAATLPDRARALWERACRVVAPFGTAPSGRVDEWHTLLREALVDTGAWAGLQSDDAGRQVIAALHLADAAPAVPAGPDDALSLDEYVAWVHGALEDASFVPEAPPEAPVVVTPLERAMLRPFASVVMPGADEKRLGRSGAPHPLLGDALAGELGLPTMDTRRHEQTLAFAQLLRLPRVTLLRRRDDGGEPLAPSPLVERLALAMRRAGRPVTAAVDPRVTVTVPSRPVRRPRPVAPDLLPASLSASACDALRTCPYRFFALRMLNLRESPELDEDVEKRDYGTWLHEVLHRFHAGRAAPAAADAEVAKLQEVAAAVQAERHVDDPSFLPYAASFARIAPRYIEWLHARERAGMRWQDGERRFTATPGSWQGISMEGVVDRLDRIAGERGPAVEVIDYKTSPAWRLRERVAEPDEDTQLAFYAALVALQPDAPAALEASYLPLDDNEPVKPVPHPQVAGSAARLVEGIGDELARVRAGAPLPALGEGAACGWCDARGLCRRDHWSDEEEPAS